ncbi:fungal-specific transcription factor domain-containing protein [Penicillium capsulatum]|uniref:Fungal-specific transcription factor domain-containing protein n=1 Tax=Penicillium capsulatum TaxID=69766 RepID=A0A9W9LX77_9EURO|nr:fungal-specific transcription factor domain-containing protein [Penicillium capsulatum]KAJ6121689.1 fungal-specific transcription factor domain-containing protein [Penicillium capsulatum]
MRTRGAACLTCRKKARKCDRAWPICKRCISKGLECGGYPDKFRFCGIASRGKWKNQEAPVPSPGVPASKGQSTRNCDDSPTKLATTSLAPSSTQRPTLGGQTDIDEILGSADAESLLSHYDEVICPHQIAPCVDSKDNPYRQYVLPLAYEQIGLLYAVLAFSACHLGHLNHDKQLYENFALDYRVKAITSLGIAIKKVCSGVFHENDRDGVFATIQILLLHDICESGISAHGAHISGAMSICSQMMLEDKLSVEQERTVFFLGNLAWLDIIRAFSMPERLCFSQNLRQKLLSLCNLRFEAVNGCPRELVLIIGDVLENAKAYLGCNLVLKEYGDVLQDAIQRMYSWDSSRCFYPDEDSLWSSVAEAFRHSLILRTWRLLNPVEPASEEHIQDSVTKILDSVSEIPGSNPLIELLVLPLFMAGADCLSPHSRHYILLRLGDIRARSEMGLAAPQDLLHKVWEARAQKPKHDHSNVSWMLFTSNSESTRQDDYLII